MTTTDDTTLAPAVLAACEIAATDGEPPDTPIVIRAAHKDYSARGRCREHWYRMVWRGGRWEYLGDRRLATGTYLAADRRDTIRAEVWPGEIVIQHDRGGPINLARMVVDIPHDGDPGSLRPGSLRRCALGKTRDGQIQITLPDGRQVVRPNPRKR